MRWWIGNLRARIERLARLIWPRCPDCDQAGECKCSEVDAYRRLLAYDRKHPRPPRPPGMP